MNEMLQRHVAQQLAAHLRTMPAVVLTGARQTGKSTLAQAASPPRRFMSLDDFDVLDAAQREPGLLLDVDAPLTLDEVQRAPGLLQAVKMAVDRDRRPGRFLLTGSANLLLMKQVSESLAGRASYLNLWPMTRREQLGLGQSGIWDALLDNDAADWPAIALAQQAPAEDWRKFAQRGGLPQPAVHMQEAPARAIWFEGYLRTYLERDLLELATIAALPDFRRLMRTACLRLGQPVNQSALGRDVALPQPTVHRYLNLLETSYMLVRLPAYSANRTKRLLKAPKLYWGDTGLALHIAGAPEPDGAHLENLVLSDLLAWRDARPRHAEVLHWRTVAGEEVDFVIEADDALLPIEIKATANPRLRDTGRLRSFRKEYEGQALAGLLLHAGDAVDWLTPDVLAVPWWRVI